MWFWVALGRKFHYSNIRSFATAFKYMKLHSKVWPCPHPVNKERVPLLLHAKNFAVSQLIFAKQELNFISRLGESFVMKICNRQKGLKMNR